MTLFAAAVDVTNANPGLAALVGAAIGGGVSALAAVRKAWRKEARDEARKVTRVMLADHVITCRFNPALTPKPQRK